MSEVMKSNVTNFDQALSGRLAGVVVRSGDGQIGQEANIVIRGNNSLTQSNSPLFVIDGFQSESSQATALSSSDIESMQVLRDASATAIYGSPRRQRSHRHHHQVGTIGKTPREFLGVVHHRPAGQQNGLDGTLRVREAPGRDEA